MVVNKITSALFILIAIVFTILIHEVVPEKQFVPYRLELDSVWQKKAGNQEYIVDLKNDLSPEVFTHHSINQTGHSIEYRHKDDLHTVHIFYKDDFFISRFLHFSDVNQDGKKEIILITVIDKIAWLNIFTFNSDFNQYRLARKLEIGPVTYYNKKPDVINYSIVTDQSSVYFDLTPGYSVANRHIYKYDFVADSLLKTDKNSFVIKKTGLVNFSGEDYLLAKEVLATGNTMTAYEYESMEKSSNKDTIEMFKVYKPLKHLVYDYGDFSSYILLYNSSLKFAFDPIEFYGWTNSTKSEFISIHGHPHIIALTNTEKGDTSNKVITLCDLKGNIVKQIPIPHDFTEIFTGNGRIVFKDKENLWIYSDQLEMVEQIPDITWSAGFFDIDGDQQSEFIAFRDNKMLVFSPDFDINATFSIRQEFAPYPEENGISLLQIGNKRSFVFNTRLFYYLFSYSKNPLAVFQYPFYVLVFLFWTGLLFLILKLHSRRLEKEKQLLEEIVLERTAELKSKNIELASQKEEIQTQAEKISEQYKHLEQLDRFKETLTHALVHDLKNPISQILIKTSDQAVNNPAKKMLRLITNMLDVEKYENAEFILHVEPHSLRNLLAEVINGQEISLKEKSLVLHFHFTDYKILVDKEVMVRVFDNLLANAIRFAPNNSSIDVNAEPMDANMLQISFSNYGDPIADEEMPYIFDKYRHFGKIQSGSHHSTGLGLTFCKMAIEAHGGKIGARNNPDKGCSFWFTIQSISKSAETEEHENKVLNYSGTLALTEDDYRVLKEAVKQVRDVKIFEISRFHEVFGPLKKSSGDHVNEWISRLFSAIYSQNTEEYNRLINLIDHEQTKNTDC